MNEEIFNVFIQELLKHKQFRGQLNVTIRFAHPYGWDAKDDMVREDIHKGYYSINYIILCNILSDLS